MAAVTICSDFGTQGKKVYNCSIVSHLFAMKWWDQVTWSQFFKCWVLSQLFHSLFHFHHEVLQFLSSLLSAIKVVSSVCPRLLIFLPAVLIAACASCSPAFLMMYSAYELNKQGDPCLGWVKSSANNRITQELAGAWKVTHRAQPVENILRGEIFSGFSPSGWAPIPPASHHRSATQLRNRSGALFHQPGSRHQHREGRENHRAMGKFPSISRASSTI